MTREAGAVPGRLGTPQRIRLGAGLVLLLSLAFFVHAFGTMAHLRDTVRLLRDDTAPSIVAAQAIRAGLAQLDALAAVELTGSVLQRRAAHEALEAHRHELVTRVVAASENDRFGDEERPLLLTLNEDLGRFFESMGDARAKLDASNADGALEAYRPAHERMEADLAIAAELDRVSSRHLDQAYASERDLEEGGHVSVTLLGALAAAALVVLQLALARWTRRVFNAGLLVATGVLVAATYFGARAIEEAQGSLVSAKGDAFDSVHILWQARAAAYGARGDECRFLLDPAGARAFQEAFDARVHQLTDADGWLERELANVTFPGEEIAATATQHDFLAFLAIDEKLRALDAAHQHALAVDLAVGDTPAGAAAAFARFDLALADTLAINERAFDAETQDSDDTLRRASLAVPVLALLLVVATLLGVRPRLREYAG